MRIFMDDTDKEEINATISKLSEEMANKTGTGLSTEAIDKLEEVGNYLAYATADGGSKWTELISILRNGSSSGDSGNTGGGSDNDNTGEGSGSESGNVPATDIMLSANTLVFSSETSQLLVATVSPSNSTDSVMWTSSNPSVVTVINGVVTVVGNGDAVVTATAGNVSATCSISVQITESYVMGYYNDSGVLQSSNGDAVSDKYIKANGTICIYLPGVEGYASVFRVNEYDSNKNWIQRQYTSNVGSGIMPYTLSDNTAYVRIGFGTFSPFNEDTISAIFAAYQVATEAEIKSNVQILAYEIGGISSTGEDSTETNRYRTGFIEVNERIYSKIVFTNETSSAMGFATRVYDSNHQFLSSINTSTGTGNSISDAKYIRLLLSHDSKFMAAPENALDDDILYINGAFYKLEQGAI